MFIDKFRKQPDIDLEEIDFQEKPIRSLAKAVSWRVTGSLDTIMLAWFFTNEIGVALSIGLTEVVTKIVLYYFHERAWSRISLGKRKTKSYELSTQNI